MDKNLIYIIIYITILILLTIMRNSIRALITKILNEVFDPEDKELYNQISIGLIPPFLLLIFTFVLALLIAIIKNFIALGIAFDYIIDSLIMLCFFWSVAKIINFMELMFKNTHLSVSFALLEWTKIIMIALTWIGCICAILEIWGVPIGSIITGFGLLGIAIAFSAQELFKNIISGALILLDKSFEKGDWLIIDDKVEGVINKIGFRSTSIKRFDGAITLMANSTIAYSTLVNMTHAKNIRIKCDIKLEYSTPINKLKKIIDDIEEYCQNNAKIVHKKTLLSYSRINELSEYSIKIGISQFTDTANWTEFLKIREDFIIELKKIVEKNNANFAFPSNKIYLHKE